MMVANVSFISHVSPCYPKLSTELPSTLSQLLEHQHDALDPSLRCGIFQALVLLRNRGMVRALELLQMADGVHEMTQEHASTVVGWLEEKGRGRAPGGGAAARGRGNV